MDAIKLRDNKPRHQKPHMVHEAGFESISELEKEDGKGFPNVAISHYIKIKLCKMSCHSACLPVRRRSMQDQMHSLKNNEVDQVQDYLRLPEPEVLI
jgi:hypothetical protein